MSIFTLTQSDVLPQIEARVTTAIADIPSLLRLVMEGVGAEAVDELHTRTPIGIGRTSGHLADSYASETTEYSVRVFTTQAEKLNWVRYGTGIYGLAGHPIVPLRAKALFWPEAPHPMASVRGQRANDFVTPVIEEAATLVETHLEPFAEQVLAILRGG